MASNGNQAAAGVIERQASWTLDTDDGGIRVDQPYAVNSQQPDFLLVTGFNDKDVVQIARELGETGFKAGVVNLEYPSEDKVRRLNDGIVRQTILKALPAVAADLNLHAERPSDTPLKGVGVSKGAGELLVSAQDQPHLWQRLVLAAPFGFNNRALGEKLRLRRIKLKDRLTANGLLGAGDKVDDWRSILREFTAGTEFALGPNAPDGPALARELGPKLQIFTGENDQVFPANESEVETEIVPNYGHPSLRKDSGLRFLVDVMNRAMPELRLKRLPTAAEKDATYWIT